MPDRSDCEEVRQALPELAVGALPGDERARVLDHLPGCGRCGEELAGLVAAVDELLFLAPQEEPPLGFEKAVLRRITPPRRSRRVVRRMAAAATGLAVAAATAGVVWWSGADDRKQAEEHRKTLAAASGKYFAVGPLNDRSRVIAYQGDPSWVFVYVRDGEGTGRYEVLVKTTDGRRLPMGTFGVKDGTGSWGMTLNIPVDQIAEVRLEGEGVPDLRTTLRRS